jgi:hypothetical protein
MAAAASALPAVIRAVFTQQIAMFAQPNGRDLCENRRAHGEMTGGDRFPKANARGKES